MVVVLLVALVMGCLGTVAVRLDAVRPLSHRTVTRVHAEDVSVQVFRYSLYPVAIGLVRQARAYSREAALTRRNRVPGNVRA